MTTLVFTYEDEKFCVDCASVILDSNDHALTSDASDGHSELVSFRVYCDNCGIRIVPTLT